MSGNNGFAGVAVCGTPTFCGGGADTGASTDASGNIIKGNIVGLGVNGSTALGNNGYGVSLDGAPNTIVGGAVAGEANVISSNGLAGLIIFGTGADGNVVRGNYIGTDVSGTLPRGNNGPGVTIPQGSNNTISGNDSDRTGPNVIMFNLGPGIHVGDASRLNKLRINRIDLNDEIGINLGPLGVSPNDPGDGDAGANDQQNLPALTSAQIANGAVNVQGTLNSLAFQRFTVDLYVSPACDPSGFGRGAPVVRRVHCRHRRQRKCGVQQVVRWRRGHAGPGSDGDRHVGRLHHHDGGHGQYVRILELHHRNELWRGRLGQRSFGRCGDIRWRSRGPGSRSATVVNTGNALVFQVRFAPGTFNPQAAFTQVLLDTDRNAATGHAGTDSACGADNGVIGSEYIYQVSGGGTDFFRYLGPCNTFDVTEGPTAEFVTDGFNLTVSLDSIGSNGALNYKVLTFVGGSGVLDVMPNNGLPAATTAAAAQNVLGLDFVGGTVGYPVDPGSWGWQFKCTKSCDCECPGAVVGR